MQDGHSTTSWASQPWYQYGMSSYGCQYWSAAAAYSMMGYCGLPAYGYGSAYGTSAASAASVGHSSRPSVPVIGKKGDYKSLLEEMKAKQAMRDEHKKLSEQIAQCDEEDQQERDAMQYRLNSLEHELWRMGESSNDSSFGSSCTSASALRPPEDGRADQFSRLCHALAQFLRAREGQCSALSLLESDRKVQQEWKDLTQSKIVTSSTKLKHLVLARPGLFELRTDAHGQPAVRLVGDTDPSGGAESSDATASTAWPSLGSSAGARGDGPGGLRPDEVATIQAYLKKAGGSERVSRLGTMFGVGKAQLGRHFTLYEDRGKLYATPGSPSQASGFSSAAPSSGAPVNKEVQGLERLLRHLTTARSDVGEAMVFCIDNGARQAATFARTLVRAVEDPDLSTDEVLARLFLISDVLYNSNACVRGASRYHSSFQDLLPDAMERLGRNWLQRFDRGRLKHARAEEAARRVLAAWQEWAAFPPLFVRGLEALLFEPVPEAVSPESIEEEADEALRRKLSRWCSSGDAARLPYAARLRGLAGPALPTTACRARLCHYERYWHSAGAEAAEESAGDVWGEELRRAALSGALEAASEASSPSLRPLPAAEADSDPDGMPLPDEGEDGLDGEPLSDGDEELEGDADNNGSELLGPPLLPELWPRLAAGEGGREAKRQRTAEA